MGRITRPLSKHDVAAYYHDLAHELTRAGISHGDDFEVIKPRGGIADPRRYHLDQFDEDAPGASGGGPDQETSVKASLLNFPFSGSQRHRLLNHFVSNGPCGADQAGKACGISVMSARPRILELKAGGWLSATGEKELTEQGAEQRVYRATDKARLAVTTDTASRLEKRDTSLAAAEQLRMAA